MLASSSYAVVVVVVAIEASAVVYYLMIENDETRMTDVDLTPQMTIVVACLPLIASSALGNDLDNHGPSSSNFLPLFVVTGSSYLK